MNPCSCEEALTLRAEVARLTEERDEKALFLRNAYADISRAAAFIADLQAEVAHLREDLADARNQLEAQAEDNRELVAEVARLRAALEPTAENVEAVACMLAQGDGMMRSQESHRKRARTTIAALRSLVSPPDAPPVPTEEDPSDQ